VHLVLVPARQHGGHRHEWELLNDDDACHADMVSAAVLVPAWSGKRSGDRARILCAHTVPGQVVTTTYLEGHCGIYRNRQR
jgi:hypothetical protein